MPQAVEVPQFLLLPEVKVLKWTQDRYGSQNIWAEKTATMEVCPKCATASEVLYDHRWIRIHDQPLHGKDVWIHIHKRRFYCKQCRKPFTEPISGIKR